MSLPNNPLLNDTVIERDYGIDKLTHTKKEIKEEIKEPVNTPIEEPKENISFDPNELNDIGIKIPQMEFEDDEDIEYDDSKDEEIQPQAGYELFSSTESVKPLASVFTSAIGEYLPKIAYSFTKQDISEIKAAVDDKKLPFDFISFFEQQNKIVRESLQISKSSLKEFNKALIAYLRTKKIETTSPLWAVILQGVVIATELTVNSISANAKMNNLKEEIFAKYNIK